MTFIFPSLPHFTYPPLISFPISLDDEDAVTPTNNLTWNETLNSEPLDHDRHELESRIHAMEVRSPHFLPHFSPHFSPSSHLIYSLISPYLLILLTLCTHSSHFIYSLISSYLLTHLTLCTHSSHLMYSLILHYVLTHLTLFTH